MLSRIRGVDLVVARAEPESVASSRGGHAEVLPLPLRSSVVACSVRLRVEAARFLMLNRPPPLLGDGAALLRSPDRRRRSGDCAEELGAIRTCRARSAPGCRRGGHSSGRQFTGQARRRTRFIRQLRPDLLDYFGVFPLLASAGMPSHRVTRGRRSPSRSPAQRATRSRSVAAIGHPMDVNMEANYKPPKPKKREVRRF